MFKNFVEALRYQLAVSMSRPEDQAAQEEEKARAPRKIEEDGGIIEEDQVQLKLGEDADDGACRDPSNHYHEAQENQPNDMDFFERYRQTVWQEQERILAEVKGGGERKESVRRQATTSLLRRGDASRLSLQRPPAAEEHPRDEVIQEDLGLGQPA